MKQIIQNYSTGVLELAEVPVPVCPSGKLLVRNAASLISIGTERSIIELGKKSLLGKARARPDLVKRFMDKAKNEGFVKTFKEALGRLDNPTALGYSSAGIVVEVGPQVQKLSPGDRVACIGAGYASHAELITVPSNLCCKIPDNVTFEEASFGMLGITALHGIRCADLTFGASVTVIGLGLLGLLSVQILKSYGCKVFGLDIDTRKARLAQSLGAEYACTEESELKSKVERETSGHGVDAVLITASTKSAGPVNLAVDLAMFRGKVVLVGVADIHPQRNEMWHKEVEIIVSKAGGPGTFDPFYENRGIDYPAGYVRWTENRNLEEFLRLEAENKIDVKSLISHRFKIEEAEKVYKDIIDNRGGPYIGVILQYPEEGDRTKIVGQRSNTLSPMAHLPSSNTSEVSLGVIGAGLFGKALLLPALRSLKGVRLKSLSTSSSANTYHTAKKYGFEICTTDYREVLSDEDIRAVIVLTPHSLHARMVCDAIESGKHVFVEKPLCISEAELRGIINAYYSELRTRNSELVLMVGYNRRFSPHAVRISEYFQNRHDPMVIHYRVNAGFVPPDHWVHSDEEGGGRIVGEVCHFVDFMQYLTGSNPVRVFAERISGNNRTAVNNDNVIINVKFADGSIGNIVYSASGDKAFSRERIEVFCEGKTVVSTDFRETLFQFAGKKKTFKTSNQSMGYEEELQHFLDAVAGRAQSKLTPHEIFLSTVTVLGAHQSLGRGAPYIIELPEL
jgi:predicted dehydrogenase/threonine dehydrogenase-like Zn-dependent dehydrogenase